MEFNEDLSAFHGPTIEAQTAYTARAVTYILSLYPSGTPIIVMGHSMGGIVATSLLPSSNISAIITMSTPHTLPPARFDARIDQIYDRNRHTLSVDPTPILSLCGGATDMMIPSESCVLPSPGVEGPWRKTVFTSALEGAWTGVGHQEMVWCHQVRWCVARAALELGSAVSPTGRSAILDQWLRDGHALPPSALLASDPGHSVTPSPTPEILPRDTHLVLRHPRGSSMHLLPVPTKARTPAKFVLFVSDGMISPVGPHKRGSLSVSVSSCSAELQCRNQRPTVLKLIPSPIPGRPFPIPQEGSDESEGIVLFEADVDSGVSSIGIHVENGQGQGWVTGGFVADEPFRSGTTTFRKFSMNLALCHSSDVGAELLLGPISVPLPKPSTLRASYEFPHLLSNALIVYRIAPRRKISDKPCPGM